MGYKWGEGLGELPAPAVPPPPSVGRIIHVRMSGNWWAPAIVTASSVTPAEERGPAVLLEGEFEASVIQPGFLSLYPCQTLRASELGRFWRWPPREA